MSTDVPDTLRYTPSHEWVGGVDGAAVDGAGSGDAGSGDAGTGSRVRVGITNHAQDALGDIVFVSLPEPGTAVQAGTPCGELESTKSVSELNCPVDGTVVARNEALADTPETVNSDPYGEGWLLEVELADPDAVADLLDAAGYAATLS